MSHTHSHRPSDHPEDRKRQRTALRILITVLIPLGVWTVIGLIALWPGDISEHVQKDLSTYTVEGVSTVSGEISTLTEMGCEGMIGSSPGSGAVCASGLATVLEGPEEGAEVDIQLTAAVYSSGAEVGDKIVLFRVPMEGGEATYQFSDFERKVPLIVITIAFAVAVVAVARWRGLASLIGLAFAGFIMVKFMFPALVAGSNPILVGLVGSSAIMFVVLYSAHGFSARTTTALVGTLFGLILTAGLGYAVTKWAHLTGVASEDDFLLAASAPDMNLVSVVMCGIIIAGLGVLNDVTITQASAVWELAEGDDSDQRRLFSRAMRIGRDHIASTVYTIAFATAGAALSALLLIAVYQRPLFEVLQTETFSGEIIRTLVGSIGLVLAVPLTTAIGVVMVRAGSRGLAPAAAGPTSSSPAQPPASDPQDATAPPAEGRTGQSSAD